MTAIALLFLAGLILLGFEVIVPGAVLGIVGSLALLSGVIVAFVEYGVGGGLATFSVAVVLIGGMLFLEFYVLPRTKAGKRMFLHASVSGTSQPGPDRGLVGSEAKAVTPLNPSGFVLVNGRRYDAFSQSGHADSGTSLRVVGVDNFRVIVNKP